MPARPSRPHRLLPLPPVASSRILTLCGEVKHAETVTTADRVLALGREADSPILLVLDSDGGAPAGAYMMANAVSLCRAPVVGLVITRALSAGFLILQACDLRLALPSSVLLAHHSVQEFQITRLASDSDADALAAEQTRVLEFRRFIWKREVNALSARSGLNAEAAAELLKHDQLLSAAEALDMGFIDGIVPCRNWAPTC